MLPLLEGCGLQVHRQGGEEEAEEEEEEEEEGGKGKEGEALDMLLPGNKPAYMCHSVAITVMPLQGSSVLS